MHQIVRAILSRKEEMEEVHDIGAGNAASWFKDQVVVRHGFYVCGVYGCQKTFVSVASKRRHMAIHFRGRSDES